MFSKKFKITLLHTISMIAIVLIVGNLSPVGQITEYGMKALGCFAAAIYGWLTLSLSYVAFIMLLLASFVGLFPMDEFLVAGFSNTTTITLILSMAMFSVIGKTQISQKMAGLMLNSKISQGRPWIFYSLVVFATWMVSFIGGGIIAMILLFPIITAICEECGYERYSKSATLLYLGCGMGAVLGALTIPVRGMPLYLLGMFKMIYPDAAIPFLTYFIFTTIFSLLILVVFILFVKFVLRVDYSKVHAVDVIQFGLTDLKFSKAEKFVLTILTISILMIMVQPFIKVPVVTVFGTYGFYALAILLLIIIPIDQGKAVATWQELGRGIPWDIIITVVICVQLCGSFSNADSGIIATITTWLSPVLTQLSPTVFIIVILFVCMILTNFLHNGAVCIMCYPLVLAYAALQPIPIYGVVSGLVICCHLALATPAASVYSQMMFGFTDLLRAKDIMKYSFMTLIPVTIIASLIAVPLMNVLF